MTLFEIKKKMEDMSARHQKEYEHGYIYMTGSGADRHLHLDSQFSLDDLKELVVLLEAAQSIATS